MRRFAVAAAFAVMAVAHPAAAADPVSPPPAAAESPESADMNRLMQYVATPEYFKNVTTVALGGEHDIAPDCKTTKALGRAGFVILRFPIFASDTAAIPVAGAWKDQVVVDRCGAKIVHNVLVEGTSDGIHVGLLMPGQTAAPADWQGEVLQSAAMEAKKASGCKDDSKLMISDTAIDKNLSPMKADDQGRLIAGKWRELWRFRACGKPQTVAVTFTADGKGRATWESKAEK